MSDTVPDRTHTPFDQAARSQLAGSVRAAVSQLPPRQRRLIELVELQEYSAVEAAELLEISPGTARWHLHQARATLRGVLRKHKEEVRARAS
jgi:RNA polymerase sigma-70 factor (ECF subfamily)